MPILYHYMDCPYCFRVRLYAAERGVSYESVVVERGSPPPELPSLNPLRRLPVWITDDNKPIFGSNTIIDYLEAADPDEPLIPADPIARARCWMADELARDGLLEPLIALDRDQSGKEPEAWDMVLYRRKNARVRATLQVFEALLGGREWLVGDELTIADLSIALPLSIIERFGIELEDTPAVAGLAKRLSERDSMRLARMRKA
jgi:glutathione S-transferase